MIKILFSIAVLLYMLILCIEGSGIPSYINNYKISKISSNVHHSLALSEGGEVFGWGRNDKGQLHLNKNTFPKIPSPIKFGIDIVACQNATDIATGEEFSVVLTEENTLCFSGVVYSDLSSEGFGSVEGMGTDTKQFSAGKKHIIVLTDNGDVYSLGDNSYGQLGIGSTVSGTSEKPVNTFLSSPDKAVLVYAADYSSFILSMNGFVYACGNNSRYVLALPNQFVNYVNFTKVDPLQFNNESINMVSSGSSHSAFISSNQTIFFVGSNNKGQLGIPTSTPSLSIPNRLNLTFLIGDKLIKSVSAVGSSTSMLTEDGKLVVFGHNINNTLSPVHGIVIDTPIFYNSTLIDKYNLIQSFTLSYASVLTDTGNVFTWGNNFYGTLGKNSSTDDSKPGNINVFKEFIQCNGTSSENLHVCSGNGTCIRTDKCECDTGFVGTWCQEYSCNNILQSNSSVCSGNGNCSNVDVCDCNAGYEGKYCEEFKCNGTLSSSSKVCSGNGSCIRTNECECDIGFGGIWCEEYLCNNTVQSDSSVCSGNGFCIGVDTCNCTAGYGGVYCEYLVCNGTLSSDSSVCSGNGNCSNIDVCDCNAGYVGKYCGDFTCNGTLSTSSRVCSGNGTCVGVDSCVCYDGYTNQFCEFFLCNNTLPSNSSVCSSRGSCISKNTCKCKEGFFGNDCEHKVCSITYPNILRRSERRYEFNANINPLLLQNIDKIEWHSNITNKVLSQSQDFSMKVSEFNMVREYFSVKVKIQNSLYGNLSCSEEIKFTNINQIELILSNINQKIIINETIQPVLSVFANGSYDIDFPKDELLFQTNCSLEDKMNDTKYINYQTNSFKILSIDTSQVNSSTDVVCDTIASNPKSNISTRTTFFLTIERVYMKELPPLISIPKNSIVVYLPETEIFIDSSFENSPVQFDPNIHEIQWEILANLNATGSSYFKFMNSRGLRDTSQRGIYFKANIIPENTEIRVTAKVFLKSNIELSTVAMGKVRKVPPLNVTLSHHADDILKRVILKTNTTSSYNSEHIYSFSYDGGKTFSNLKRTQLDVINTPLPYRVVNIKSCSIVFRVEMMDRISKQLISHPVLNNSTCLISNITVSDSFKDNIKNFDPNNGNIDMVVQNTTTLSQQASITGNLSNTESVISQIKRVINRIENDDHFNKLIRSLCLQSSDVSYNLSFNISQILVSLLKKDFNYEYQTLESLSRALNDFSSLLYKMEEREINDEEVDKFKQNVLEISYYVLDALREFTFYSASFASLNTDSFRATLGKVYSDKLSEIEIFQARSTKLYFKIPDTFAEELKIKPKQKLIIKTSVFKHNPYPSSTNKDRNFNTISLSFNSDSNEEIKVENLQNNIAIEIPYISPYTSEELSRIKTTSNLTLNSTENLNQTYFHAKCVYWNTKERIWSEKGCKVKSISEDSIICSCNHLTSFSVFLDKFVPNSNTLTLDDILLQDLNENNYFIILVVVASATSYITLMICAFGTDQTTRFYRNETRQEEISPSIEEYGLFRKAWEGYKSGNIFCSLCFRPRIERDFTRPQRVTVVYVQVLATMCANALFFSQSQGTYLQVLAVLIATTLISTPITLIVLIIFKKIDNNLWCLEKKEKKLVVEKELEEYEVDLSSSSKTTSAFQEDTITLSTPTQKINDISSKKDNMVLESESTDSKARNLSTVQKRLSRRTKRKEVLEKLDSNLTAEKKQRNILSRMVVRYELTLDKIDNYLDNTFAKCLTKIPDREILKKYFIIAIIIALFCTMFYFGVILIIVIIFHSSVYFWDLSLTYFTFATSMLLYYIFVVFSFTMSRKIKKKAKSSEYRIPVKILVFLTFFGVFSVFGIMVHIILPFTSIMPWEEYEACFLIAYITFGILIITSVFSFIHFVSPPMDKIKKFLKLGTLFEMLLKKKDSSNNGNPAKENEEKKNEITEQKSSKPPLPSLVLFIVYPIVWVLMIILSYVIIVFGVSFGNQLSLQWFLTTFLSLLLSILVKEPFMSIMKFSALNIFFVSIETLSV